MKKVNLLIGGLLLLLLILGVALYFQDYPVAQEQGEPVPSAEVPAAPTNQPIVRYPVPAATEPKGPESSPSTASSQNEKGDPAAAGSSPAEAKKGRLNTEKNSLTLNSLAPELPSLQLSDPTFRTTLAEIYRGQTVLLNLLRQDIIQRLVTTIDTLPGPKLQIAHLPVPPPKGRFIVSGTTAAPQTSSRNQQRYARYLELVEQIDPELALQVYIHYYPLFQTAYERLGYQSGYFNDRLVYVIDHLLETPNPPEPILLSQPEVLYRYADPALETLSAGQKLLLRIGREQRLRLFQLLTTYREKLTNLSPAR